MIENMLDDEIITGIYQCLKDINDIAGYENIQIKKYETTGTGERIVILNKNVDRPVKLQYNDIWLNIYVPHLIYNNQTYRNYQRCFAIKNQVNQLLDAGIVLSNGVFIDIDFTGQLSDPFVDPDKPDELCYVLKYKILTNKI